MNRVININDERYRILGTNAINFSKWSRENFPKSPQYKVGDKVTFTIQTEVLKVYNDCDGTPLYELEWIGNGWSESHIQPIKESK